MPPLKAVHPLVRQLTRVGLAGAVLATAVFFLGPWFPAFVRPYNLLVLEAGTSVAVVCLLAALAVGAFRS